MISSYHRKCYKRSKTFQRRSWITYFKFSGHFTVHFKGKSLQLHHYCGTAYTVNQAAVLTWYWVRL